MKLNTSKGRLLNRRSQIRSMFWLPILLGSIILIACKPIELRTTQGPALDTPSPTSLSPIISVSPGSTQMPPPSIPPEREPAIPTPQEGRSSKVELTANPLTTATSHLAGRLSIDPADIRLVSSGEWTTDPVDCDLELADTRMELLLEGEHVRFELAYKDRLYEYWVFRLDNKHYVAVACH